jgi:ferric-dicitrate binding protein FerR (iron transport regulator)
VTEKQKKHLQTSEKILPERITYTTRPPSGKYAAEPSLHRLWMRMGNAPALKNRFVFRWKGWSVAACAAALLAGLAWFVFLHNFRVTERQEVVALITDSIRQHFTLPDGSAVWLNANSRLTYTQSFGCGRREVSLTGEACFEVVKDAGKPFIVNADPLHVQVLGTVFNIRAYPSERTIATTLVEGSVQVGKADASAESGMILQPNQQLVFDRTDGQMMFRETDGLQQVAWKDGQIIFKQTPLAEALLMIERYYGVTIVAENNFAPNERKITGRFRVDEGPEQILRVIRESVPLAFTILNDTIYIR